MPEFQHLSLIQVIEKKTYNAYGGGTPRGRQAQYNLRHRQHHFDNLSAQIALTRANWEKQLINREENGLSPVANENVIPVFLHLDVAKDIESLKSFGIEIISEEEGGFIIGANADNFSQFTDRLDQFLNESNRKFKDSAAGILELITSPVLRLNRILSPGLLEKWDLIDNEPEIVVYVAISSYIKTPDYPARGEDQTNKDYDAAVVRWRERNERWQLAKDDLAMKRQSAFEAFIHPYNGSFVSTMSQYQDFDDGFGCKIRISGKGLKDLALNFPYVFNIAEHDHLCSFEGTTELERLLEVEVSAPLEDAPKVCVIDSGIQEQHRLLQPAIDDALSISYVPDDADTFDKVNGGGHGTRVAGAVLFPNGIDLTKAQLQAPFWIQNARILNERNYLSDNLDEAALMRTIVDRFHPTRIFNLSVSGERPIAHAHMDVWPATIDKIMYEKDVLFCIAAGNIPRSSNNADIPGISNFITHGLHYPHYLKHEKARITKPAHSCFALTIGSISDSDFEDDNYASMARKDHPSSFCRSGLGLWGMIKPDVVEYGGDVVIDKATGTSIDYHEHTSPSLIRSTRDNGPAVGRDVVGTSFTTPKVTHIVAALQQLYPKETCMLYRALVVQSARIPEAARNIPEFIQHYGYGIPDIGRATTNSSKRVTLYNSGMISPKNTNIYLIKIPEQINRPGYNFDILIEVTLSYKAEPRITRRKTNSYLSAWLDWEASKKGEDQRSFTQRLLTEQQEEPQEDDQTEEKQNDQFSRPRSFRWTIASKTNNGVLEGIRRQDSTVQKDWCIEKSNQLPPEFLIAIKGHKGWEKDLDKEVPYSIAVSFEILDPRIDINIYEEIRIANEVEVPNEVRIGSQV